MAQLRTASPTLPQVSLENSSESQLVHANSSSDSKAAIGDFEAWMTANSQHSAISIDPLGGISRLDTLFFVYNFSSEGLQKTAKSVVACCVVKSSADIKEVDDNTLRVLVNQCFETSDLSLRKAIYLELRDALFNSKDPQYIAALRQAQHENEEKLKEWAVAKPMKPIAAN
jgi:hypothetical protein